MSNVREPQYQTDEKFNWNRLLSLPFAREIETLDLYKMTVVQTEITRFPDVSFYQGVIDFAIMAKQTKGIIIRAGQGTREDSKFVANYSIAKSKGLKRGIYWFYDDRYSPREQFEALKKLLDKYGLPEMEIWCDWENTYGGGFGKLRDVVAFMQLIEKEYAAAVVGMYTGFYWFTEHSNPVANFFQYQYLKNKPLWLAYYNVDITKVRIPYPWTFMRHWQYGTPSIGISMGVETQEIDMNIFTDLTYTWEDLYKESTQIEHMEVEITWQM